MPRAARSHFSRKNTRPVHHPTNHLGTPAVPWKLRAQSAFPISRKKDKEPTRGAMLGNSVLLTVLAFSPKLQRYGAAPTAAASAVGTRPCVATMGLFDAFKKGFENKDYSQSPGTYEQTNALSRRFECALPAACCLIADALPFLAGAHRMSSSRLRRKHSRSRMRLPPEHATLRRPRPNIRPARHRLVVAS